MYYSEKYLITMMTRAEGFKKIPSGYHIIGVRSDKQIPNEFNCTFHLMEGEKLIMSTTGTTIPGTPSLLGGFTRYNKVGSAVVVSNRVYDNVWKYGKHGGWMPALKQLGNKILVGRDGNKDKIAEDDKNQIWGYFGINFHTATKSYLGKIIKKYVNNWSHGCQVVNNSEDYMKIINMVKHQSRVSYTLLDEFSV